MEDNFIELGVVWTIAGDWGKPSIWSHSPHLPQPVMKGRNRGITMGKHKKSNFQPL
jgi:hypothetical protein